MVKKLNWPFEIRIIKFRWFTILVVTENEYICLTDPKFKKKGGLPYSFEF